MSAIRKGDAHPQRPCGYDTPHYESVWLVFRPPGQPSDPRSVYTLGMGKESNAAACAERLVFRPMAFPRDAVLSVRFSEDAFICSFGTAKRFWAEAGRDGRKWIARLGEKVEQDERIAVNAWLDGKVVGQVVLGASETQSDAGHVNLYYLVPGCRGRGLAPQLDAYAVAVLRDRGYNIATLNVSPKNIPAVRFYLSCGWRQLGPRVDAPYVDTMEKTL